MQPPGNIPPPPLSHHAHASPHLGQPLPPPPPPPPLSHHNGIGPMGMPFEQPRRRSLGAAGSPPQFARRPMEPSAAQAPPPPPPPPSYPSRNMPPPSPPQMPPPSANANHLASAPRGPPTTSPFAGVRDFATHRPNAGMSISSMLGGNDERKPTSSPHSSAMGPSATPKPMRPASPGRARSSSMREPYAHREPSPARGSAFGEQRAQSAFHDRPGQEARRDGVFASSQFPRESPHSFRAFRPEQEQRSNGLGTHGRPNSQPTEPVRARTVEEIIATRERPSEGRFSAFRHFGEPGLPPRSDIIPRHDAHPFPNGVTSQPRDRDVFASPHTDRDMRQGQPRYQTGMFSTPLREEQSGIFRPMYHHAPDTARESIETRQLPEYRREEPGSSPPVGELPPYMRARHGFVDRPMTFEEHQRMEAMQREQRKESDGSAGPKPLLAHSPDIGKKGRNSPLPQAVQGAQPRHVGPGGGNPGIKMEFGRMFSGIGSGVGSTTPNAGQNGTTTPSRMSPARHVEDGDLVRTAVNNIEDWKSGKKNSRRGGRRPREEDRADEDGRATPDVQRGNKRNKTAHPGHHHHHHHHHHHEPEPQQGSFNTLRFSSNPASAPHHHHHHHHHHHTAHAHPSHHHHHHAPRAVSLPRKPTITVTNTALLSDISHRPRKHLGSQLYTTEIHQPSNSDFSLESSIKFVNKMKPIPNFEGQENCTYTVRVPRDILTSSRNATANGETSSFEAVCKQGHLWGTEVYTDDSDVVAAAVHSGWIQGDFGEQNEDLKTLCDNVSDSGQQQQQQQPNTESESPPSLLTLPERPRHPAKIPPSHPDLHITLLLLPPLESYPSTTQHHVRSKSWRQTPHDGMSFMIHRIDFVDEGGLSTRNSERGIVARKQRIAVEEAKRRDAAAGLLMFAHGGAGGGGGAVSVGA
ncbi:hypothetical protein D0862_14715 [Hortaea werneckii]|uniref:Rxt3-domain-containing protein n=1 Tax=Hortaea werneckii TaxID=91943 RepID=A0A3M7E2N8_HORWE|nr:hypothetical protein D0862_14715 [Hortaea werneckii]